MYAVGSLCALVQSIVRRLEEKVGILSLLSSFSSFILPCETKYHPPSRDLDLLENIVSE